MAKTSYTLKNKSAWVFIAPALLWAILFFVTPMVIMTLYSFWERKGYRLVREFTLSNYNKFFERSPYYEALINSLEITAIVTIISVILAYPMAYILAEYVPKRWQKMALLLTILPFWTSYVVRSYSWLLVLADKGIINNFLINIGIIAEPLSISNNRIAITIGFVHFFTMLITLTIFANLIQLSPNYRKAAYDLGAGPIRCFIYVILPLTLPGIVVGAFLTFVLCIGDYITPHILGGYRELLMPQIIMLQIGRRADFPTASAMSLILMMCITVAYIICAKWLRIKRA